MGDFKNVPGEDAPGKDVPGKDVPGKQVLRKRMHGFASFLKRVCRISEASEVRRTYGICRTVHRTLGVHRTPGVHRAPGVRRTSGVYGALEVRRTSGIRRRSVVAAVLPVSVISTVAVVLTAAVMLITLAACGGSKKELKDLDIAINLKPEDIHIYTQGYGNNIVPLEAGEIDNMTLIVGQTLSDSIKVTPVFHWLHYEKFDDEIEKLVKSGERVDVITTSSGGYGLRDRDVLVDLGSLFPEYAPNYYNELISHAIGLQKLRLCTVDDKLICIPANGIFTQRYFILARKDLAEELAPDGFETLEDYGEFMAKVKEKYPIIVPGSISNQTSFFNAYIRGNGYFPQATYIFKKWDSSLMYEYYPMERLEEFASAYNLLKVCHEKGYIKIERNAVRSLVRGEMASALVSGPDVGYGYLGDLTSEYEFVIDPLYMNTPYEAYENTEGWAVGKSCTCPERVMMLLEWIHSSQEAYDLFVYGIKNRNYVLDGDRIAFTSEEYEIKPMLNSVLERYFKDYRYERLQGYHPENFKEVYRDACIVSVMTTTEMIEKFMGISPEDEERFLKDQEVVEKYMKELGNMQGVLDKYNNNWNVIMDLIGKGDFSYEPAGIIEMQRATGIDKYLDLLEQIHREVRGE